MTRPYLGNPKYTIEVLQKYGFVFQKRFGQNFLISNMIFSVIDSLSQFEGNQGLIADLLALSVHTTFATKADKKHPYLASKQFYFDDEKN